MGYEDLRIAKVRRGVMDYNTALACGKESSIKRLEKFFLSEWGQFLSGNYGEYIIERCKKNIKLIAKGDQNDR